MKSEKECDTIFLSFQTQNIGEFPYFNHSIILDEWKMNIPACKMSVACEEGQSILNFALKMLWLKLLNWIWCWKLCSIGRASSFAIWFYAQLHKTHTNKETQSAKHGKKIAEKWWRKSICDWCAQTTHAHTQCAHCSIFMVLIIIILIFFLAKQKQKQQQPCQTPMANVGLAFKVL